MPSLGDCLEISRQQTAHSLATLAEHPLPRRGRRRLVWIAAVLVALAIPVVVLDRVERAGRHAGGHRDANDFAGIDADGGRDADADAFTGVDANGSTDANGAFDASSTRLLPPTSPGLRLNVVVTVTALFVALGALAALLLGVTTPIGPMHVVVKPAYGDGASVELLVRLAGRPRSHGRQPVQRRRREDAA